MTQEPHTEYEVLYMTTSEPDQYSYSAITTEDVQINTSVTKDERVELLMLINNYRDIFAKNLRELRYTTVMEMQILEKPDSVPVTMRPYKTSATDRQHVTDILKEWRANGIISDTQSPYASPVVLVNKPIGEKDSAYITAS